MKIKLEIPDEEYAKKIEREMAKSNPDYKKLYFLCFDHAIENFKNNDEHFDYLYAARFFELMRFANQNIKNVEILGGGCKYCQKHNGEIYPIMEAIEKMPIPHRDCLNGNNKPHSIGFCNCIWLPVVEDD